MIQMIDNFLSKTYHKELLNILDSAFFHWVYNQNITVDKKQNSRVILMVFLTYFMIILMGVLEIQCILILLDLCYIKLWTL